MRKRVMVAIAVIAVLVAGGVAWATVPDTAGVIHGCRNTSTGALRVIDTGASQTCSSSEAALNWNQRGITFRGAWSSTTAYAKGDVVTFYGSSYYALANNTNVKPGSNAATWAVLAAKGATGPRGPSNGFQAISDGVAGTTSDTEVVRLSLPAGSFQLAFHSTPEQATAANSNLGCFVTKASDGSLIDQFYGDAPQSGNGALSWVALVTLSSADQLVVSCIADVNTKYYSNRLVAVQVASAAGAFPGASAAAVATNDRGTRP